MRSVLVSFSGGVDSSYLLKIAHRALGSRRCGRHWFVSDVRARGNGGCSHHRQRDRRGTRPVDTAELTDPRYADNTHQRCFFCKSELYTRLKDLAESRGLQLVVDGSNTDDLDDFRPGMRAARDLGVRSPLQEVGLAKAEIRLLSEALGLRTWDKPAVACLSSRFAYGDPITVEKLRQVASAESAVCSLGFSGFRVRHHDAHSAARGPPRPVRQGDRVCRRIGRRSAEAPGIGMPCWTWLGIEVAVRMRC